MPATRTVILLAAFATFVLGCAPSGAPTPAQVEPATRFLYEYVDEPLPPMEGTPERAADASNEAGSGAYILTGTLLRPGSAAFGGLLIEHGVIQAIWEGDLPLSLDNDRLSDLESLPLIDTDGIILPGLIDLDNHATYGVLSPWKTTPTWPNRYAWAANPDYQESVHRPYQALRRAGLIEAMNIYGEVRAIAGGTTSIVGATRAGGIGTLVRHVDRRALTEDRVRVSVGSVEEFGCPHGEVRCPAQAARVREWRDQLESARMRTAFFHVAAGGDETSRAEFDWLVENALLRPQVVLVHGTGLSTAEFAAMGRSGMGLVWTPRSDMNLYAKTADIAVAKSAGVPIALASEWSATGSANLLAELRFAARYNRETLAGLYSPQELLAMVTSTPAALIGLEQSLGKLEEGFAADLLVLESRGDDAYASVFDSDDRHVRLVTVGGTPVYGAMDWLGELVGETELETLQVRGRKVALNIKSASSRRTFAEIRTELARAYAPYGKLPAL